jgi:HEAT repeat protein
MKLKLLVAVAAVLGVLVVWQLMQGSAPPLDELDARMEDLRVKGDTEALAVETPKTDIRTARRAVKMMGYLGRKGVKPILVALKDPRPEIRQEAAVAYARAADPKEAAPLAKVARNDKVAVVRAAAITGLGRSRAYEEMETLLEAMDDDDIIVRRRAAESVVLLIGRRYPYDANASSAKRLKSIAVIRKFWARAKGVAGEYYERERKRRKDAAGKD